MYENPIRVKLSVIKISSEKAVGVGKVVSIKRQKTCFVFPSFVAGGKYCRRPCICDELDTQAA